MPSLGCPHRAERSHPTVFLNIRITWGVNEKPCVWGSSRPSKLKPIPFKFLFRAGPKNKYLTKDPSECQWLTMFGTHSSGCPKGCFAYKKTQITHAGDNLCAFMETKRYIKCVFVADFVDIYFPKIILT